MEDSLFHKQISNIGVSLTEISSSLTSELVEMMSVLEARTLNLLKVHADIDEIGSKLRISIESSRLSAHTRADELFSRKLEPVRSRISEIRSRLSIAELCAATMKSNTHDSSQLLSNLQNMTQPLLQQMDALDVGGDVTVCPAIVVAEILKPKFKYCSFTTSPKYALSTSQFHRNLSSYGCRGSEHCKFSSPMDAVIALYQTPQDSKLLVSDHWNNRIQVLGLSTGTFIREIGREVLSGPCGLALWTGEARNNHIDVMFVCDFNNHCVRAFNVETGQLHFTLGGAEGTEEGQFKAPWGVCLGEAEHTSNQCLSLFVTDCGNDRVQVFNVLTRSHLFTISHQLSCPYGVCFSPATEEGAVAAKIFVADHNNHRVQVFVASTGEHVRNIGEGELLFPLSVSCNVACASIICNDHNNNSDPHHSRAAGGGAVLLVSDEAAGHRVQAYACEAAGGALIQISTESESEFGQPMMLRVCPAPLTAAIGELGDETEQEVLLLVTEPISCRVRALSVCLIGLCTS